MPGAFTPTCHSQAPGYIENHDEFKANGINEIYIISVNDVFVTKYVFRRKPAHSSESSRHFTNICAFLIFFLAQLINRICIERGRKNSPPMARVSPNSSRDI